MTPPQGAPGRAGLGRGSDDPRRVIPDFHPFGRPRSPGRSRGARNRRRHPQLPRYRSLCASGASNRGFRPPSPVPGPPDAASVPDPDSDRDPTPHPRPRALAPVRMAAGGGATGAPRPRSPEGRSRARPTAHWPAGGAALTMVLARPGAARAPQSSAGLSRRYRRLKLISAVGGSGKQRSSPRRTDQWTRAGGPHLPALRHAQQHSHWLDAQASQTRAHTSQWEAGVRLAGRGLGRAAVFFAVCDCACLCAGGRAGLRERRVDGLRTVIRTEGCPTT